MSIPYRPQMLAAPIPPPRQFSIDETPGLAIEPPTLHVAHQHFFSGDGIYDHQRTPRGLRLQPHPQALQQTHEGTHRQTHGPSPHGALWVQRRDRLDHLPRLPGTPDGAARRSQFRRRRIHPRRRHRRHARAHLPRPFPLARPFRARTAPSSRRRLLLGRTVAVLFASCFNSLFRLSS